MTQASGARPRSSRPQAPARATVTPTTVWPALSHLQQQVQEVVLQRQILASCRPGTSAEGGTAGSQAFAVHAQAQIVDLITRSLLVGLQHQLRVRLTVSQQSLKKLLPRLLLTHRERIYAFLAAQKGEALPEWKLARPPSLKDLEDFVSAATRLSFPGKGLVSTLNPTLKYLDTGKRQSGGMDPNLVEPILQALGEPGLLEAMYPTVCDTTLSHDLAKIARTATGDAAGRLPAAYPGRHALDAYAKLVAHAACTTPQVSIRFSEAERIHLAQILQGVLPHHPTMGGVLARLVQQVGSPWPCRAALPDLDNACFDRLVTTWRRSALAIRTTDASPPRPGSGRWPIFLAPEDYVPAVARALQGVAPYGLPQVAAEQYVAAWYADGDGHGVVATLTYDEVNLAAEAVLHSLLRPQVPLSEVLLAASILSKTGLPWLPPASPPLALHEPRHAVRVLLGAAGLLDQTGSERRGVRGTAARRRR